MAKWKCDNIQCLHKWSEDDPLCCPQCGTKSISQIQHSGFKSKAKLVISLVLLAVIGVMTYFIWESYYSSQVSVKVQFSIEESSIEVQLDKPASYDLKDFTIELVRSGSVYQSVNNKDAATFSQLNPGVYYINIRYSGLKRSPTFADFNKGPYTVIETKVDAYISQPVITNCFPTPDFKAGNYSVTIEVSPDSIKALCEFSVDYGQSFTKNNIFVLKPGNYMIMTRIVKTNIESEPYELVLDPIISIPSKEKVQLLVTKLSEGDLDAYEELNNLFNNAGTVEVVGAGDIKTFYNLINDCMLGNKYQILNLSLTSNQLKVYVKKI